MQGAAELIIKSPGDQKVVVVSAMGSAPNSPLKVTDMILNMISKAAKQDAAFLVDLASLQEKHIETAKLLLGGTSELTAFVSRLMDDIANLKAMLQAISIGEPPAAGKEWGRELCGAGGCGGAAGLPEYPSNRVCSPTRQPHAAVSQHRAAAVGGWALF
jgi:hypothetical protein